MITQFLRFDKSISYSLFAKIYFDVVLDDMIREQKIRKNIPFRNKRALPKEDRDYFLQILRTKTQW